MASNADLVFACVMSSGFTPTVQSANELDLFEKYLHQNAKNLSETDLDRLAEMLRKAGPRVSDQAQLLEEFRSNPQVSPPKASL